ncbi:hypothetical protein Tco_0088565 [Tanacetum coccineum]
MRNEGMNYDGVLVSKSEVMCGVRSKHESQLLTSIPTISPYQYCDIISNLDGVWVYDSDCDDRNLITQPNEFWPIPQFIGSDVLAEVPNPDNMDYSMINQGVQKAQAVVYQAFLNGNVIKNTVTIVSPPDSEETLMLAEESRSKMLLKQQDPMVLEKKVNTTPVDYVVLNQLS